MRLGITQHPRAGEIFFGLAALYWGAVVALWPGPPGLGWAGLDYDQSRITGLAVILSSLVLAVGCRINGRWRWSPVVRLAGVGGLTGVALCLAWHALYAAASAWAVYSFTAAVSVVVWVNTAVDVVALVRGVWDAD